MGGRGCAATAANAECQVSRLDVWLESGTVIGPDRRLRRRRPGARAGYRFWSFPRSSFPSPERPASTVGGVRRRGKGVSHGEAPKLGVPPCLDVECGTCTVPARPSGRAAPAPTLCSSDAQQSASLCHCRIERPVEVSRSGDQPQPPPYMCGDYPGYLAN